MCLQNQNVHIQLEESRRFQSIKYQFTPDPSPFHRITYLRGKIHIAFLLLCQTKTLQRKTTLSEVPIQEEVLPPAVITVYIYLSIYRRVCGEYIYTVMQKRAVERRASRCWCSMGNPLHHQGSPVSTGCWEVLGYWV